MGDDTLYAVCPGCGHVEPRPAHAAECWDACEHCGEDWPQCYDNPDTADDASQFAVGYGVEAELRG